MTGEIKRVFAERGFAFIACEGIDYFMHIRDTDRSLPFDDKLRGRIVEFEVNDSGGKTRAVNVRGVI